MKNSLTCIIRRLCFALMILIAQTAIAQTVTVTGSVTDTQNEPLVGAVVAEKGNLKNSVMTDVDGKFTINVAPSAVLKFSYTGFISRDESLDGRRNINVVLSEDLQSLDEVVVIGYGTMRRKDLTGAVASVKGEEIASNPVSNVAQAMQGRLPGVNVLSQDGRPGASI